MNIIYDSAGEQFTVMRVSATPGDALSYEMRAEFNGVPDSFVYYHSGKLHRFCPDGQACPQQGAGLQADPFTKVGTYRFIVAEAAEWDCISPKGAFPVRVRVEPMIESGAVSGDTYVSTGTWLVNGEQVTGPALINVETTHAELVSGAGLILHIGTHPLT